ncbi:MAG: PorT family protein, partial [Candidatus Atribacteria bacterium]
MKRLIIALALVALMSSTVFAEGMTFGVKAGLNLANLAGDDIEDMKMKLCFGGGVFMNYPMTESISLQPELLFMMKGAKVDVDEVDAG